MKRITLELDLTIVPMSDYEQKRNLLISTGEAPEIVPIPESWDDLYMDEIEREEANMLGQSLSDYVKQMTLQLITGKADIDKEWDAFVQKCKAKGADRLVQMSNEIYQQTKDILK